MKQILADKWEKGAEFYFRNFESFQPALWRKITAPWIQEKNGFSLDVGTGPGQIAFLMEELGWESIGLDASRRMIEIAKKTAAEKHSSCQFVIGDAEELPFKDGVFDSVWNRLNVWTLPHPGKFVFHAHRVLKPGGSLVIFMTMPKKKKFEPNTVQEKQIFTEAYKEAVSQLPYKQAYPGQISALLDAAGFTDVSVQYFTDKRLFSKQRMLEIMESQIQKDPWSIEYATIEQLIEDGRINQLNEWLRDRGLDDWKAVQLDQGVYFELSVPSYGAGGYKK
jgi:ubiquinone/menaquinone biosynthesis C-methylase UbiE